MWTTILAALACIVVAKMLAYHRANGLVWSIALAAGAAALTWGTGAPPALVTSAWVAVALFAAFSVVKPLRRVAVSGPIFGLYKKILPQVSQTEQEALDAGSIWWDADLFTGRPDWKKLLAYPQAKLSGEEQAFLDGPVEELCGMLDEWQITHERMDLPPEVWSFIREKGFLGIIIPKSYGGLGFGAYAHSEIVTKISSRSGTAAVTVMVPNSLGPAELLHPLRHRGAEEPLSSPARQGARDPVLRAHQSRCRLRRRRDSGLRHRLQGPARGPRGARHPPHLGEALHHAGSRGHPPGPRLQALRSRQAPRRGGADSASRSP